jgi:hypothetical protein
MMDKMRYLDALVQREDTRRGGSEQDQPTPLKEATAATQKEIRQAFAQKPKIPVKVAKRA